MSSVEFMLAVARTWGHIAIGAGIILAVFLICHAIGHWYNGIIEQVNDLRRKDKFPPQPWKYQ